MLYPLKFKPIYKETLWGGSKIKNTLNKTDAPSTNCGESWEISGVKNNISIIENGAFAGKSLKEIINEYKGEIVGKQIYKQFADEFPLLIKFIDATDVLSIQVHPDDELAKKRHDSFGKTEFWYIIENEKDAELISGFSKQINKELFVEYLEKQDKSEFISIFNREKVAPDDVFFLPAGRIHAIGKGILLAEIQQTSDITYRVYDWDRVDNKGNARELHTELALDAIDFNLYQNYKTPYTISLNNSVNLIDCKYFTANTLHIDKSIEIDYSQKDSFVLFICLEGEVNIICNNQSVKQIKGETILIPAVLKKLRLEPQASCKLIEVYIH